MTSQIVPSSNFPHVPRVQNGDLLTKIDTILKQFAENAKNANGLELIETAKNLLVQAESLSVDLSKIAELSENIGLLLWEINDLEGAKEHFQKVLNLLDSKVGSEYIDRLANAYNNLGSIFEKEGNFASAKQHHDKSLFLFRAHYGENDPKMAVCYNSLGVLDQHQNNLDGAHHNYELALYNLGLGNIIDSPLHQTIYSNLGVLYEEKEDLKTASEYYKKALVIEARLFGLEDSQVIQKLIRLGPMLQKIGSTGDAKECYEMALKRLTTKEDLDDKISLLTCYKGLASTCFSLGEFPEAKTNYLKVKEVSLLTSNNNLKIEATRMIAECEKRIADPDSYPRPPAKLPQCSVKVKYISKSDPQNCIII